MTDGPVIPPPAGQKNIVARVRDILMKPNEEWGVIDAEPSTIASIFTTYVLILAAIGPIAIVIGQQLIGINYGGITWKPSITYSIGTAVITYVLSLVVVYVAALIIDALAPNFNGTKDPVKAFKVSAYTATAGWVAAIFNIIPMLGILALLGSLYGLYLLFLGLPRLMRVPADKAVAYTLVVILIQIVLYVVVALVVGVLVVNILMAGATVPGMSTYRY
ncbi:MAG TPA: YIP1 family protein [Allosphingosinicella sp.]|nr:YIP1 family protein [Allosphingosinicella sp.]